MVKPTLQQRILYHSKEYLGDYRRRQLNRVRKLYLAHGKETVPENVLEYARFQLKNVITMLSKELEKPTLKSNEMFDIIEHLPPNKRKRSHNWNHNKNPVGNIKNERQARDVIISLSEPSKMPCWSYNLPAQFCITGSKLVDVEGTICNGCYALKGWYKMEWVMNAMMERLKAIWHPDWIDAMIYIIRLKENKYFRWHDSGDLQSIQHLDRIIKIAKKLPDVKFWLPTREYDIVEKYWKETLKKKLFSDEIPNLIIRLSANKFDTKPPVKLAKKLGVQTSMVSSDCPSCPAHEQNDSCKDCRSCWNPLQFCITYLRH